MRGEDGNSVSAVISRAGSPPHARGRQFAYFAAISDFRITPACAGKTRVLGFPPTCGPDHPRMRGEDVELGIDLDNNLWITPACAGKTSTPTTQKKRNPDHPRMRGEDSRRSSPTAADMGSPPHARGRPPHKKSNCSPPGITPACAGKTSNGSSTQSSATDHPRMRGEDLAHKVQVLKATGSPPHARGRRR